mmetsp:Transcript_56/g.76  ORF Transcript_56/g.76 Transcript_56/m.76 type:complete len:116 (+) Transcript_56:65-412(+)
MNRLTLGFLTLAIALLATATTTKAFVVTAPVNVQKQKDRLAGISASFYADNDDDKVGFTPKTETDLYNLYLKPFVMLSKFVAILCFKTIHDAVYYPMVWSQRMIQCQSLEECEVE